jgi:hypothetical protein
MRGENAALILYIFREIVLYTSSFPTKCKTFCFNAPTVRLRYKRKKNLPTQNIWIQPFTYVFNSLVLV